MMRPLDTIKSTLLTEQYETLILCIKYVLNHTMGKDLLYLCFPKISKQICFLEKNIVLIYFRYINKTYYFYLNQF